MYLSSVEENNRKKCGEQLVASRTQSPLQTGEASPCCGGCSPRTLLMPTAPRTMLATPRPTSTKESRSRLHRILRLEHILPRASLQLQKEEASTRRERTPLLGVPRAAWLHSFRLQTEDEGLLAKIGPYRAESHTGTCKGIDELSKTTKKEEAPTELSARITGGR